MGSTSISPDGSWVAFTVSVPRTEATQSDFLTQIHLVSADGTQQFQLTRGDVSASNPQWSPCGGYLAFTSTRGGDGNQIWLIKPTGGEAWQLTSADGSVGQYQWSNSGRQIAFTMTDSLCEEQRQQQRERRDVNVVDQDIRYAHLYVFDVDPDAEEMAEITRLTEGAFHVGNFDWSPDDATIAFDHQMRPEPEYWTGTNISSVPGNGGTVELLVDLGGSDTNPLYSPDGHYLAFTTDRGDTNWPGYNVIKVKNLVSGEMTLLGVTHDDRPLMVQWSPEGDEIFYWEFHNTSVDLFAMPVTGQDAVYRQITKESGQFRGYSLSRDGTVMSAIHQDFHLAPDVIISEMNNFEPVRLTDINAGYEQGELARARIMRWEAPDGMLIEGPLIYPLSYEEGKQYPVILHVHGGPADVFGESYVAYHPIYPLQKFAAEGYFILRPNYRGSGGYGKDFRFAIRSEWGYADLDDMLVGLDILIEEGKVDPNRQAIMGWSYGGYMSSMAITRTDRFSASMMGAGVSNLNSMTGTSDITSFLPDYFESEYWENYERWKRHSAIFNVENVTTPTLILHPEQDIRVPPTQGYEFYVALKRLGVDTKMVTYPRQPHGFREPKFAIDAAERQIEWLRKHL